MLIDRTQTEQELRALLQAGVSLGDALRTLHHERGLGLMFLWPAVMTIQQLSKDEAVQLVVRETSAQRT
jgi:hypothetical protein